MSFFAHQLGILNFLFQVELKDGEEDEDILFDVSVAQHHNHFEI
jgi:hypothetical protein